MKMKKLTAVFLCLALVVCFFASCGSGEVKNTEGTTTNTSKVQNTDTTTDGNSGGDTPDDSAKKAQKAALKQEFLKLADEVTVGDDTVTFKDATSTDGSTITVKKNPGKTVNLYASFTTLWYEAGGSVVGCIGGSSSQELYVEYIGRDITTDAGMNVVATSSSGKKWDAEKIIALNPDLIICSTAMSGYSTIQKPAEAAGIQVIAVSYNDFADYLKWFKVFSNLTGHADLWDSVAMKALDDVVNVLVEIPEGNGPKVFAMFSGSNSLQANTSSTVVGAMATAMHATNIVDAWENTTGAERLDINLETVFAADPDIIIIQCHAGAEVAEKQVADTYGSNPVWQSLKAVKNGKVFYLEKTLFHNKPNSRFADAYEKLAEILYPDVNFSFKTEK